MKKVIVFGATGTVGAYACLHLHALGMQVIAVGHRPSDNGFFQEHGMSYYSVDISRREGFLQLPQESVFAIVQLAAMLPARMKGYCPQEYIDINVTGMLNVLEYAARVGVQRVVYSQSISDVAHLCGNTTPIGADVESHFPIDNDHSVYSITKNAASDLLRHYAHHYGMKYYILRFPNIYLYHPNPYYYVDGVKKMQGYRRLIYQAMRGETIEVWGNPNRKRDMVYVKDCTQIIGLCLTQDAAASGVYNVGTGVGVTLDDQIKGIIQVFSPADTPSQIVYRPEMGDAPEYVFDVQKTMQELRYQPRYMYLDYLRDFKKEMEAQTFHQIWGYEDNDLIR